MNLSSAVQHGQLNLVVLAAAHDEDLCGCAYDATCSSLSNAAGFTIGFLGARHLAMWALDLFSNAT